MKRRSCSGWCSMMILSLGLFGPADYLSAQSPSPAPPADQDAIPPTLEQVSPRLDLGLGKPLSFLSGTITLVNSGDRPITLDRAIGECACTDATILRGKKVLQPGEDVEILVAVEFPREMGIYTKHVLVYEEGNKIPFLAPIDFEVGYPVRVNGGTRFAIVTTRVGSLRLDSVENKPFRVLSVHGRPPVFDGYDPVVEPPRTEYVVQHDFSNLIPADLPRWVIIETDHPGAEMMAIPARIQGWKPIMDKTAWRPIDEFILLGRVTAGKTTRVSMTYTGKPVIPGGKLEVESSNPDLLVGVANVRKPDRGGGMVVDFDVVPRVGARGLVSSVVTLKYDGAATAFDLFARVEQPR